MPEVEQNKQMTPTGSGWMRYRQFLSLLAHIFLFAVAFFFAFGLYYNFKNFNLWFKPFFVLLLPIVVAIRMSVFALMKMFRGSWRYVGMRDMLSVIKATHISTFFFLLAFFLIEHAYGYFGNRGQFPQAVFLLDWGTTIATICGARILVRLYHEEIRPVAATGHCQCLIVGASDTGEALLREILRMPVERYRVVGFLDDDSSRHGTQIHGVPVLGPIDRARDFCEEHEIEELLLAIPGAPDRKSVV